MSDKNRQFNSLYDKMKYERDKCNGRCDGVKTHRIIRIKECCVNNRSIRKMGSTSTYSGEEEYIKSLKKQCLDRDRERERKRRANGIG